ncbi:MAG: hypothetical protein KUA35_01815 [Pseudodesulfovibrio sp.]|uniref:Uncharacterized protein n=1 Tax=Pseudodesulfovibrio aespoeensis (strain ATCC 700646 / DSM 10631 / Aspo-2) TaxID=643562 RepID=E6VVF7_PSEA9|nr:MULTISPECIES: hypothetical protein [Pseudodesulfovibrio]MBU4191761.1 hypothetical protein [Pseudomonadota bacterium]ADU62401.1 hypothetical protein Daes_1387 [Pseudodesulfovibrio aespoeensis Aspo-2]MBU4244379.1 hypothetical protein [Pseudomonadota bacterium]MBU4379022.1 hypothetical protein [Pseudomonadota bacterium]MBU4473934.1 hypothetical protein [Pseudomonadota bacterium]
MKVVRQKNLLMDQSRGFLKVFSVSIFLVAFCSVSIARSDIDVNLFLNDAFKYSRIVSKWETGIRYGVIGLNDSELRIFGEVCSDFAKAADVSIGKEEIDVNALFVFSSDIKKDLARNNIYLLFRQDNELYESYLDRIGSHLSNDIIAKAVIEKSSIINFSVVVDKNLIPENIYGHYSKLVMMMLFGVLNQSGVVSSSALNYDVTNYSSVSDFDKKFVGIYYGSDIKHGMSVQNAIEVIRKNFSQSGNVR